jgi:phosphatidylserine/phosphatidylglycerophosphate/cardiolipin synthase-like enzyme
MGVQHRQENSRGRSCCEVFFGGPDLQSNVLRNLLAERISAVPAGGSIDWVTYYFRDQRLAEELLWAHRRGVKVTVTLEKNPRTAHANKDVIKLLSGPEGLGEGFRTLLSGHGIRLPGINWKPHLHEKLYCFSHPRPIAFIGSFNPSGDGPDDDPLIIREIGDQDRGHNVLVGLVDPILVKRLVEHARWINRAQWTLFHRFTAAANLPVKGQDTEIHFWPRVRPHPAVRFLLRLGAGARIRIVASHIKGAPVVKSIIRLARHGAIVEILAEPTLRRVPIAAEQDLMQAGILFRRITHPEGLPMHNKFVLAEQEGRRWVIFGSFNWTMRSYWLNYEIGAISTNDQLINAFAARWEDLAIQGNRI